MVTVSMFSMSIALVKIMDNVTSYKIGMSWFWMSISLVKIMDNITSYLIGMSWFWMFFSLVKITDKIMLLVLIGKLSFYCLFHWLKLRTI